MSQGKSHAQVAPPGGSNFGNLFRLSLAYMMMRVAGNPLEIIPPRRAGGFDQQNDLVGFFHAPDDSESRRCSKPPDLNFADRLVET